MQIKRQTGAKRGFTHPIEAALDDDDAKTRLPTTEHQGSSARLSHGDGLHLIVLYACPNRSLLPM